MKRRTSLLYIVVAISIVIVTVVVLTHPTLRHHILELFQVRTMDEIRAYVHSLGAWAPVIVILMMVLHSVSFIPSEVITVTDMVLFGPLWGVVYAWVGSMLGAYLAYFLARWFGRPLVNRFVPTRALQKFDQFVQDRGVSGFFILRLIPLVSFNALNYASGLTTLTFWQFTWTTGFGILPGTLLIALLYRSAVGQRYAFIGLVAMGVLTLLVFVFKSRLSKE